ncbi:MAG: argininosuccinate lyase, partial [Euryarchaeota archaeon]|nr:argininosuccinate lyase [Euryarchaeota archaeon]
EATNVAAGAVATAEWEREALTAAAGEGFSTATGVADALAMQGLPFRTAHELVAVAAEQSGDYEALEAASREVLGESLEEHVSREAVESALDPEESVTSRDSAGGPAPTTVGTALASAEASIVADEKAISGLEQSLDEAAERLKTEVARYG